jgi:hypothetical protein
MYVALNPKKIRQFTTKGIHLTLVQPVGYVPDDLEPHFRAKIDKALQDEELFTVAEDEATGLILPQIGSSSGVKTDEEARGTYTVDRKDLGETQDVVDPFGKKFKVRRRMITLKFSEDSQPAEEPKIVLTDRS